MTETWSSRDLPVLIEAAEHLDQSLGRPIDSHTLAGSIAELSHEDVARAAAALSPTYLTSHVETALSGYLHGVIVTGVTDEGRRAAGLWPSRADHLASLLAAVEAATEQAEDEDERTRLQRLGDALSGAPKRITEAVVAGVISGQLGA